MQHQSNASSLILGICIALGLAALGYLLGSSAIQFRELERTVKVKGLAEQEYPANVVLWPIEFTLADNSIENLYTTADKYTAQISGFLQERGIDKAEISISSPQITDKTAQQWGGGQRPEYRFSAVQTVTVYSTNVTAVRKVMSQLSTLGKQGIVFSNNNYDSRTEYLFTRLNDVKPKMIEEATKKAREVAIKFASDSDSQLGKIKRASQGTFSITARDSNNPHIKQVRVVSTVEYYLSD